MQPLWHARVKLTRAAKHIEEAKIEYERFASSEPVEINVTLIEETDDEWKFNVEKLDLDTPYLTTAIVGDAIHNIRSALDVMACEFVREMGGCDKGVHFPFAKDEGGLDEQIKHKKFDRAGPQAVALLKTFEPYGGGNAALRGLHDADNEDKHSRLASTEYAIVLANLRMTEVNGVLKPVPDIGSPRDLIGDCRFPADSAFPGAPVFPTLEELVELVQGIIEAFSALLISIKKNPQTGAA
jgi:hypothetical protein